MNKVVLPAFLCLLGFSSFAQVSNGDFEDWRKVSFFQHPYTGLNTASSNYHTFFENGALGVSEVALDETSVLHVQNTQSNDGTEPGYFIFGGEPTNIGEDLVFEGGFEMTDLTATGISMHMTMDIPEANPGFVLVQFKSEGMPVGPGNYATGTYLFPISGSQEWSLVEFDFDGPLDESTDQCVVVIASADLVNNDATFAPSAMVEVDNVSLMDSDTEVPGGDFESWAFVQPMYVPFEVEVQIDPMNPSFVQSEMTHGGEYALQLNTIEKNGELLNGNAFMGIKDEMGNVTPTIEIQRNHSTLSFWYVQSGVNEDVSNAKVTFYTELDDSFAPVFMKSFELSNTQGYELFEFHFHEELELADLSASHISIEFESSATNSENTPQVGTTLVIDDVELSGSLGIMESINKNPMTSTILSYPNPTMGRVIFKFTSPSTGYYRMFNQQGVLIETVHYKNKRSVAHDLFQMPAGNYLFKFRDTNGFGSSQVVKL